MSKRKQFWEISEVSFDCLDQKLMEKVLAAHHLFDPVFDAVCDLQEAEAVSEEALRELSNFDSTQTNQYWYDSDFWASQWILHKRRRDRLWYAKASKRAKKPSIAGCSGLKADRTRCSKPAKYVCSKITAGGNRGYQRRCEECFMKVKDKTKYEKIQTGHSFKLAAAMIKVA